MSRDTRKYENGKKTKAYQKWFEIKYSCDPSSTKYSNLKMCEDWKDFYKFNDWYTENYIEGLVFHYSCDYLSPETCSFMNKKESNKIKIRNSNLKKYGVENFQSLPSFRENRPKQSKEIVDKRVKSIKNRSKEDKAKSKLKKEETNLLKYGNKYPQRMDSVKEKVKNTCIKRYGVRSPSESKTIKSKIKETCLNKYGSNSYTQTKEFIKKSEETCLKKYGVKSYNQSDIGRERLRISSIKRGIAITINGKTLTQIAKDKKLTPSSVHVAFRSIGSDVLLMDKKSTSIESFIKNHLESINIDFLHNKKLDKYFPDFRFDKTIIECDGLYWHSELRRDKYYHKKKRDFYLDSGYKPFFFREDEILNKQDIIKSIINNRIGLNNKIYARKCTFSKVSNKEAKEFCENNHLMGHICGKPYGLFYKDNLVSLMIVKKKGDGLDISRFCCLNNNSVIGGFSKLIKNIERELDPEFIQTFIDLRYGSGDYLANLGFIKKTEYLSFRWTKDNKSFHRMNFPSNTGYKHGFNKIWDCGQAKWVKYKTT